MKLISACITTFQDSTSDRERHTHILYIHGEDAQK